jgi:hypothetical protein
MACDGKPSTATSTRRHHQRIHLGQRLDLGCQQHAVGRWSAASPVIDGGFDVGDVDGSHGAGIISRSHEACVSKVASFLVAARALCKGAARLLLNIKPVN